ncbi:MAG: hypothetical protein EOP82_04775 [Variovorax sp.]|nr:MAG: hypothetical protein EOP82_04775 [Variovorax sp.]
MPYAEAPETIWLSEPGHGTHPAESAVYLCLTSASALLDVARSLRGHLETPVRFEQLPQSRELSELSKAAGQAAFLAAVMLAPPVQAPAAVPGPLTHAKAR